MESIGEFKQTWRVASLALLILALVGPWTYEVINVPAEYSCNAPYVRLEGDYCGEPMPGAWIIFGLALGFISNIAGFLAGTVSLAGRARELLFMFLSIFPVLALLSSLLLLWKKDSRGLAIFQLVAWGLASVLSLLWIVFAFNASSTQLLWGAWIYAALPPVVLVMELLALRAGWKEKQKP
jgi:hypothetical protein